MTELQIHDDPSAQRFVAVADGVIVGIAQYSDSGHVREFSHTSVDPSHSGQGVGKALVKRALETTSALSMKVRPTCSFVNRYLSDHPELATRVTT